MDEFEHSYTPDTKGQDQYNALRRALYSYRDISALRLREDLDILLKVVFNNGDNQLNRLDSLEDKCNTLRIMDKTLEGTIHELNSVCMSLQMENSELRQLVNELKFRIDNGQYENK
jgi:hypothetical protein